MELKLNKLLTSLEYCGVTQESQNDKSSAEITYRDLITSEVKNFRNHFIEYKPQPLL